MEWQDPNVARSRFATQKSIKSMPFWCLPAMLLEWKNVDWSVFTRKKINVIPKLILIKKKNCLKGDVGPWLWDKQQGLCGFHRNSFPYTPSFNQRKKEMIWYLVNAEWLPNLYHFLWIYITFWTFKHNLLAWCKWCRMISHNLSFGPAGFLQALWV